MSVYKKPSQVEIVYFTGTGGTKRVAERFTAGFTEQGLSVHVSEINNKSRYTYKCTDMIIVLYPVYALNAPKPIYDFMKSLPTVNGTPAVVISVSGGGEITPNTACRLHCIKRLYKKGFQVVYERMIVMPSNVFIATPDELSLRLLEMLPSKVEHIINDLLSGITCRTRPNLLNRFLSFCGELEKTKIGAPLFIKNIKVDKSCNGCGLCSKACPSGNIVIRNNVPFFADKCAFCLKCIYDCPKKALRPRIGKFIVLKQGYNLNALELQNSERNPASIEILAKGYSVSGIKKYLLEK